MVWLLATPPSFSTPKLFSFSHDRQREEPSRAVKKAKGLGSIMTPPSTRRNNSLALAHIDLKKKNQLNDTKRGRSVSNNELWYCNGNSEKKSSRSDYKEVLENKCELFCAKIRHDEYWSGQTYLIFVFPVQSNSALQPKELHSLKKTNKQTNEQNRIILLLAKHVALTVQKWLRFIPSLPGNVWLT